MTSSLFRTHDRPSLPESAQAVTLPIVKPILGAVIVGMISAGMVSSSHADTLPHLPADCFTYTPGQETNGSHSLSSKGFHAELTGTGLSLSVASATLSDHNKKLDAASLSRINAAAAYGALTAYHHGMSAQCAEHEIPETDEIKNARPEASWSNITLSHTGKNDTHVQTVHINVLSSTPDIHTRFEVSGLPHGVNPLMPSALSGDIDFQPSSHPPYHVTLRSIKSTIDNSDIEGRGTMLVAPSIPSSQANIHLSIGHIGSLIEQVGKVAPAKITAALLLARMMGQSEGDHITGWDIKVENGKMLVNGVSVPMPISTP